MMRARVRVTGGSHPSDRPTERDARAVCARRRGLELNDRERVVRLNERFEFVSTRLVVVRGRNGRTDKAAQSGR